MSNRFLLIKTFRNSPNKHPGCSRKYVRKWLTRSPETTSQNEQSSSSCTWWSWRRNWRWWRTTSQYRISSSSKFCYEPFFVRHPETTSPKIHSRSISGRKNEDVPDENTLQKHNSTTTPFAEYFQVHMSGVYADWRRPERTLLPSGSSVLEQCS